LLSRTFFAQKFDGGILVGGALSQVDATTGLVSVKQAISQELCEPGALRASSLQLEMEYIQKGSRKNDYFLENATHTYILRLHYLEIPSCTNSPSSSGSR